MNHLNEYAKEKKGYKDKVKPQILASWENRGNEYEISQ